MKILRYLLAIAMVVSASGLAKADTFAPDDFAAVVVDPPTTGVVLTSTTFPVTLTGCTSDQLDGLSTSDFAACFTGLNNTGTSLTSLTMEFPAITLPGIGLDLASCPTGLANEHSVLSPVFCGFTDSTHTEYLLEFAGGSIPTLGAGADCSGNQLSLCIGDSLFTIAFGGPNITVDDFPQSFTAVGNSVTPEPGSIWLMSTGMMSIGLFAAFRRRQILCAPRP